MGGRAARALIFVFLLSGTFFIQDVEASDSSDIFPSMCIDFSFFLHVCQDDRNIKENLVSC